MKKLYYAKQISEDDVVFFGEYNEAESWIKKQRACLRDPNIEIKEIINITDVPEKWKYAIYWGCNPNDHSVSNFFQEKERHEFERAKEIYFSLKDKYEKDSK